LGVGSSAALWAGSAASGALRFELIPLPFELIPEMTKKTNDEKKKPS